MDDHPGDCEITMIRVGEPGELYARELIESLGDLSLNPPMNGWPRAVR
jgi:hypothetical protein